MAPRDRTPSVSDLRSFHIKVPSHLRRHPPWKLSNQVRDLLNESSRPARASSPPRLSSPKPSIADQVPSADKTWDWYSNAPRITPKPSFHGGSVLLSDRANVEFEQRPQTYGFERDPILEGDAIEYVPEKRLFPDSSHRIFDTGEPCEPDRRLRSARPIYDQTRAGVRTDVAQEFRPCFRRVPVPASYHQEVQPRPPPRSHLWRSRDIITQQDPEFVPAPTSSIKTFPKHCRRSSGESTFRSSKRLLRPSESETALRTMHFCIPDEDRDQGRTTLRRIDKNQNNSSDVINYRFSGGICPEDRRLCDRREEQLEHERALELSYQNDVVHTQQLLRNNVERARRRTSIF